MKKAFIIFLFISYSLCQEPAPIKSGIAPYKNEYSKKFDVINYDLEIGLGEKSEQIAGIANITIVLNKNIKQIPLDFTGLSIQSILINNSSTNYDYKKGKIFIDAKKFEASQTLIISIAYSGKPDDGLIIGKNVHGNHSVSSEKVQLETSILPSLLGEEGEYAKLATPKVVISISAAPITILYVGIGTLDFHFQVRLDSFGPIAFSAEILGSSIKAPFAITFHFDGA